MCGGQTASNEITARGRRGNDARAGTQEGTGDDIRSSARSLTASQQEPQGRSITTAQRNKPGALAIKEASDSLPGHRKSCAML